LFDRLTLNRKSQIYKTPLDISRLLLLNYHPDIKKGKNDVLALMFDMNVLWEKFVFASLRKKFRNSVHEQQIKYFWKPLQGKRTKLRSDIVINDDVHCVVLDTKWKILNGYNPSDDDLRQMYVYHKYYGAEKVALVYPGDEFRLSGRYLHPDTGNETDKECSIISINVIPDIKQWQQNISETISRWIHS
jgi:5-methylcytosine-specific restriction enzyme subunit McrC